jgi:hypothetical protein
VEVAEGMLFVELAGEWLWRSDRIVNKPELGLGCKFAVGRAKGGMENTGYEATPIALCGSLL